MKLKRLSVKDFGNITEAVLEPGAAVSVVYGDNAAGKTSLLAALRWVVTNRAAGVPDKGDARRALIRKGAVETAVEAVFEGSAGDVTVRRRLGIGGTGAVGEVPKDRVIRDAADVFLQADSFLEVEPDRQKAVLMAAVEPTVALSEVADVVPLDEVPASLREKFSIPWPAPDPKAVAIGRAAIDALYSWCYAERHAAGKQLRAVVVPADPDWGGPKPDVAELEKQLAELRTEEQAAALKHGEEIGRRRELQKRMRVLLKRQDQLEARKQKLRFASAEKYEAEVRALEAESAAGDATLVQARQEVSAVQGQRAALFAERETLQTGYGGLQGLGAHCVIHESIACPLEADPRKVALLRMSKRMDEIEAELERLVVPELPAQRDYATEIRTIESELGEFRAWEESSRAATRELHELMAEGAKPSEVLFDKDEKDPPVPPELEALRARVTKGEGVVQRARDLAAQSGRRAKALTDQAKYERQAAELDRAVKFLDASNPTSAINVSLSQKLGAVLVRANEFLEPWGWQLQVQLDPFDLSLADGRPMARLSRSERWRVGAAVSLACAMEAGWKTVAMDGAETLLPHHRALLARMLMAAGAAGMLVIVTAAEAVAPEGEAPPGVERFWIEDGVLSRL